MQIPDTVLDYHIAIGLHMQEYIPLNEVYAYRNKVDPDDGCSPAVFLKELRSGTLEPWKRIFRSAPAMRERWATFWHERGQEAPIIFVLFWSRYQGLSPVPHIHAEDAIFLKRNGALVEGMEEVVAVIFNDVLAKSEEGVGIVRAADILRMVHIKRA